MPTGLMPKEISAAASPACAMIRVGVLSALTTLPDPSVNDQGPAASAVSPVEASEPQPLSTTLRAARARTGRHARIVGVPFSGRGNPSGSLVRSRYLRLALPANDRPHQKIGPADDRRVV